MLSLQAINKEHYKFVPLTKKCEHLFLSLIFGFQGGVLVKITEMCPPLNCSEKDHILPENQCCRVCRGKWAWWWAMLGVRLGLALGVMRV